MFFLLVLLFADVGAMLTIFPTCTEIWESYLFALHRAMSRNVNCAIAQCDILPTTDKEHLGDAPAEFMLGSLPVVLDSIRSR
jgi:hypothetical protein